MGRAGGSGGSRSGGASRHSTGSRSTSSSRSSSSLSNRPPRSYSGGGFGSNRGGFNHNPYSPPPPPPPRPRYRPHFSTRYNSPTYYNGSSFHTAPLGCGSTVIKIIIASIAVIILLMVLGKTLTSCSRREAPQSSFSSSVNTTKIWSSSYKTSKNTYFEDNLEIQLDKTSKFAENMKMFEAKTGLKPFIFTCEMINGLSVPDDDDFDELAEYIYSKNKFTNTVLLIYQESADNWGCWTYMDNSVTEEEFSNDAIDRLSEFIENNYDSSYTNGELFSKAFLYAIEN